ncbi:YgdI/YgdR family lipoprotein [Streptococcus gallolyticus]|nr:YgdI/YgdR family lipoprotein [Streptococcus gallolyticus]MBY5040706.1 YgdI/YgdR family lipoprotein [Streptococcus gallolyticus]
MKKIIGLLVTLFAVVTLAACSSDTLDGSYYKFDKKDSYLEKEPTVTIDGTIGKRDSETFTVDTKKKEFSANGRSVAYVYSEGELTVNGELYVKKGSKAYDEAKVSNEKREKKESELKKEYDEVYSEFITAYEKSYDLVFKDFISQYKGKYYLNHSDSLKSTYNFNEGGLNYQAVRNSFGSTIIEEEFDAKWVRPEIGSSRYDLLDKSDNTSVKIKEMKKLIKEYESIDTLDAYKKVFSTDVFIIKYSSSTYGDNIIGISLSDKTMRVLRVPNSHGMGYFYSNKENLIKE